MAPKNSAATKTESENADLKVHVLKVSEIDATSYKNSRSGNWHEGTGGLEDNDFEGLCASISSRGQDEPVTVRPHGKKMQLIAGFRRFAAHKKLGLATIKAFVRELDDNEARALNIRENTARNNLSGPDLAWAIWELHQGYTAKRMPVTAVAIAQEIGRNQAYVNTLLNIMRDVDPKITAHWRGIRPTAVWKG